MVGTILAQYTAFLEVSYHFLLSPLLFTLPTLLCCWQVLSWAELPSCSYICEVFTSLLLCILGLKVCTSEAAIWKAADTLCSALNTVLLLRRANTHPTHVSVLGWEPALRTETYLLAKINTYFCPCRMTIPVSSACRFTQSQPMGLSHQS